LAQDLSRWRRMNSGQSRTLWCARLFALTCMACGSDRRQPELPARSELTEEVRGVPCTQNEDCETFFCDRTVCAEGLTKASFGDTCGEQVLRRPAPPPPPEIPPEVHSLWYRSFAPENECGGYICIDHLCRSCQFDAECQKYYLGPTCAKFDDWPGKQCGQLVGPEPHQPAVLPADTTDPYYPYPPRSDR
jgi:hypothetical protein